VRGERGDFRKASAIMNPFQSISGLQGGFKPPAKLAEMGGISMQQPFFTPDVGATNANFTNVLMNTLKGVNETAQKPDALLKEAMTTGRVDIHDVMLANSKAELAVNMTSAVLTKVIQAYDRILQIQV
jgi:flagellar hook-basal body complex protein FliE